MSNLLDEAIAVSQGPQVISEQNDKSKINWVAGMSDPGEMIGCGMYQQLRRLASESDSMYQARITLELAKLPPEHRQKIIDFGVNAANRRANLAMSNGKVCFAGTQREAIWVGLGTVVSQKMTGSEGLKFANMDWKVKKIQHYYFDDDVKYASNAWSIIREDTKQELGVVGARYEPFQNSNAAEFVDAVLQTFDAKYETVGAIGKGEQIWFLADCPKGTFEISGGEVKNYLLISSSHDGSSKILVIPTSNWVVCANTLRIAIGNDRSKGFAIKHTKNAKEKVEEARKALHVVSKVQEKFKEKAQALSKVNMNKQELHNYYNDVLDTICKISEVEDQKHLNLLDKAIAVSVIEQEAEAKRLRKKKERRQNIFNEMLQAHDDPRYGNSRGTAWGAFNGVTDCLDHALIMNKYHGNAHTKKESRFVSNLNGKNDEIKQLSFEKVMKFVK